MSDDDKKSVPAAARIAVTILTGITKVLMIVFAALSGGGGVQRANAPLLPPAVPPQPPQDYRP
jgi:hypothetical protein